ncbi:MAG TPA: DUF3617 domain-containing protein [Bryobacteraceae bacterium]|nr:DUF3617 domain-containing protein [Bryobacteraceae bacterium]
MNIRFSTGLALLFCSAACPAVFAADFRPLDVKTGQWESTMTGQTSGQPPIPDELLKRLTPEQRVKLDEEMQSRGGHSSKTVSKSCLTKDKLDKPFNMGDENTKSCARSLVTSSGSKQEIHVDCSRNGIKSTGTVNLEAVDSENVKGSMQMTATSGGRTMNMNFTFSAKWIGPACTEK